MTDIVERLRSIGGYFDVRARESVAEAADEIERLRAEIAEIRKALKSGVFKVPFYATEPSTPEGWQLVPVEPTPEMLDATFGKNTHGILKERVLKLRKEDYITMLAAAPKYGVDKQ